MATNPIRPMSVEELADDLRLSASGADSASAVEHLRTAKPKASPAACASYRREERVQFQFMVFYQVLMGVLALLTLILLVWAGYLIFKAEPKAFQAVLSGVAALVASGGVLFLNRQRNDARKIFEAAQKSLDTGGCAEA